MALCCKLMIGFVLVKEKKDVSRWSSLPSDRTCDRSKQRSSSELSATGGHRIRLRSIWFHHFCAQFKLEGKYRHRTHTTSTKHTTFNPKSSQNVAVNNDKPRAAERTNILESESSPCCCKCSACLHQSIWAFSHRNANTPTKLSMSCRLAQVLRMICHSSKLKRK